MFGKGFPHNQQSITLYVQCHSLALSVTTVSCPSDDFFSIYFNSVWVIDTLDPKTS